MCSPLSGVCPDEEFDSTPYALATAQILFEKSYGSKPSTKIQIYFYLL